MCVYTACIADTQKSIGLVSCICFVVQSDDNRLMMMMMMMMMMIYAERDLV